MTHKALGAALLFWWVVFCLPSIRAVPRKVCFKQSTQHAGGQAASWKLEGREWMPRLEYGGWGAENSRHRSERECEEETEGLARAETRFQGQKGI